MTVDVHAHFGDRRWLDDLTELLGLSAERTTDGKILLRRDGITVTWARQGMFDDAARLREMDEKGIERRVLSLSTPNVYPWPREKQVEVAHRLNDALHRTCRAHPDRFSGFASLPLSDPEAALVELDRCREDLGMVGISIGSNINGVQLDDLSLEPVWARVDALRYPVFEHPMFPKERGGYEGFELPLRLGLVFDTALSATRLIYSGVFERYPNFPYIMSHSGGALLMLLERLDNGYRLFPDCRKYISRLPSAYAEKLFYDTTAFGAHELGLVVSRVGADQMLFGTDDPYINADRAHVDRLPLDQEDKDAILDGNARRVLGL